MTCSRRTRDCARSTPTDMLPTPLHSAESAQAFYPARLAVCQSESKRLQRQHILLGYAQLLCALVLLLLAFLSFVQHALSWPWLLLPCLAFAVAARSHNAVLSGRARNHRALLHLQHGLARLHGQWAGLYPRTPRTPAKESLFAADLDLFGPGSLFEFLCTARTSLGEDTLAAWLLQPAEQAEARARQAALADLRSHTALREAVASAPGPNLALVDPDTLAQWAETPGPALPAAMLWIALLLVTLVFFFAIRAVLVHSAVLLLPLLVLNMTVTYALQGRLKPLFAEAQQASHRLTLVAELLSLFETAAFSAPLLQLSQSRLVTGTRRASHALRHLSTLSRAVEQRSNGFVRLLEFFFLYSIFLGIFLQRWRSVYGVELRTWLTTLGSLEALLSLSTYHYEHPEDPFPELSSDDLLFHAEGLGHPLLPEARCVRNDLTLDRQTRLLLISGSNMSGKSTLLRAVGTAAVLGRAGAPVRAHRLRLGPLTIAASIQVSDSLQGGQSRFYAEILRLRAVCEQARQHPPILFLLDELLAGTNSHDRLAGASGIVQELLQANALGLLSTHDLALTGITGPHATHIRNAHFEDSIVDDQLTFDYKLREGVVTRSNGLALMRLIGMDV